MNRIRIIKRANLPTQIEQGETKAKKVSARVIKRQAVKIVENWIDEWREKKPKDTRQAFADLFNAHPSAIG